MGFEYTVICVTLTWSNHVSYYEMEILCVVHHVYLLTLVEFQYCTTREHYGLNHVLQGSSRVGTYLDSGSVYCMCMKLVMLRNNK